MEKRFTDLLCRIGANGFGFRTVFEDMLDLYIYAASLKTVGFETVQKIYEKYGDVSLLIESMQVVGDAAEKNQDILGEFFMNCVTHGENGQFFTPMNVCDLMATISVRVKSNDESVFDPCCGSGRMLLAAVNHSRQKGLNPFCVGADIDLIAVKMAVVNLHIRSVKSDVFWMDSLNSKVWRVYSVRLFYGFPCIVLDDKPDDKYVAVEESYRGRKELVKEGIQLSLF